jgi:hypothetical protein
MPAGAIMPATMTFQLAIKAACYVRLAAIAV